MTIAHFASAVPNVKWSLQDHNKLEHVTVGPHVHRQVSLYIKDITELATHLSDDFHSTGQHWNWMENNLV